MKNRDLIIKLLHCPIDAEVYLDQIIVTDCCSVLREPNQIILSSSENNGVKEKI